MGNYYLGVGQRIKQLIDDCGYSQKKIAQLIGVSENALVHYLKGRRPINAELVAKIAEICDASVEWILLGKTEPESRLLPNKKIGLRIKDIRINNNLTQIEMAKSLGISQGMLSDIERGRIEPSRNVLLQIIDKFDIDANWLMTGETREESETQTEIILERLKTALGLTSDSQLADFLGVKRSKITQWRIYGTLDYNFIISKCPQVDLNYLFRGKEEKKSPPQQDTTQVDRLQKEVEELRAQIKVLKELIITLKNQ